MPKHRPPKEIWQAIREKVYDRDDRRCVRCGIPLSLRECHIDHIKSGKLGTNKLSNLRTLCRRCHVLRLDHRHRGMIGRALQDGIIPANWRELTWEN